MRNNLMVFVALSLFWTGNVLAQQSRYLEYQWEETRSLTPISDQDQAARAVMLKDFKGIAYAFDEAGDLAMYSLEHKIYRLNSSDAIERYNKVYIPFWEGNEVLRVQARAIKPDGTVVMLDPDNIKEVRDEETGGQYKMFAMEGVEQGGEVEYFFVLKSTGQATLFGAREYFQYDIPARQARFELLSPPNLEFISKSYNGFPQAESTKFEGNRMLVAEMDSVEAMKEESFAMYNASRKRVEFKLGYNHAGSGGRLYTWNDAATRIYDNVHASGKAEKKAFAKLYKSLKIKGGAVEAIRQIENYVKTTIVMRNGYDPEFGDVLSIIENHYASENGMMRLYTGLFQEAGVAYEVVLTSERNQARFDPDFESWKYLSNYAFYFPDQDAYLAPTETELRYGMLPYYWTDQHGLFVKGVAVGGYITGIGQPKFIPSRPHTDSFDDLTIEIAFETGMARAAVSIESRMGGYTGAAIQPYYPFIPEERRREVMEGLVRRYMEDADFSEGLVVENGERNISPLEYPFIIKAKGHASSFIEKAGPKYLFKIGEVIGPQTEMYQEHERQNPIENDYNRSYNRVIRFNVPEGYEVKNLADLNMEVFHEEDGDRIYTFESSYQLLADGRVEVHVVEYYKRISCDIQYFEPFRAVVNAAADFNKIVLVMERKP